MNDFTKEELKELIGWGNIYDVLEKSCNDKIDRSLANKIQYMIDNYCEHESCYIDYDYQATRCRKCLEIVE